MIRMMIKEMRMMEIGDGVGLKKMKFR